jgi:hypothetical protein
MNLVKVACLAAALSLVAASNAGAVDYVDWYGGGIITKVKNCPTGNWDQHVNKVFHARFLPAGVDSNGSNSSLSFLNQHWAQGYALAGNFDSSFKTVTSQTIARFPGPAGYTVQVRVTKQTPDTITNATPMITLQGQVSGFSGFPNNASCVADFSVTLFRP